MDLTTLSDQLLIEELLALSPAEPVPTNISPHICEPRLGVDRQCSLRLHHILEIARELLIRNLRSDFRERPLMDKPAAFRDWIRLHCANLEYEVFMVVYLDAHNRMLDVETMFRGTLAATTVYPREVIKSVLARNAAAVVFVHNHPSGDPEPSLADMRLTTTLKTALNLVDVRCLDHFIVAGDHLLSMAERGLM